MSVPRCKKKKKYDYVPEKPKQNKIMEANWLCLTVAVEQLYSDCGWRETRLNRLITYYWEEMTAAHELNQIWVPDMHDGKSIAHAIAESAGKLIGADICELTNYLGDYKRECYKLCVGALVKALKRLKVTKFRIKLIVGEIFHDQKTYEVWSVCKECADITGFNVREKVQWD